MTTPFLIVPLFSFAWGIGTYFSGTAHMWTIGRHLSLGNLDPQLRCYWRSSGCIVTGAELFWQVPNNAGIRLMVGNFGPVPGHYHGKYPTRADTWSLLENPDKTLTLEELVVESKVRKLAIDPRGWEWTGEKKDKPQKFKVVDVGNDCTIVDDGRWACLFDRASGVRFATYGGDRSEE